MIKVEIPIKTISEANVREHWAQKAKRAKGQRLATSGTIACKMRSAGLSVENFHAPIIVKLVRLGKRRLDGDNLSRSFKAVRDGVADALGIDDGDERLRFVYGQAKGDYGVEITIC